MVVSMTGVWRAEKWQSGLSTEIIVQVEQTRLELLIALIITQRKNILYALVVCLLTEPTTFSIWEYPFVLVAKCWNLWNGGGTS